MSKGFKNKMRIVVWNLPLLLTLALLGKLLTKRMILILTGVILAITVGVFYARESVIDPSYGARKDIRPRKLWGDDRIEINQSGVLMMYGYDEALSAQPRLDYDRVVGMVSPGTSNHAQITLTIENGVVRALGDLGINPDLREYLRTEIMSSWQGQQKYEDFISSVRLTLSIDGNAAIKFKYEQLSIDQPPNPELLCYAIPRDGTSVQYLFPLGPMYPGDLSVNHSGGEEVQTAWRHYQREEMDFRRRMR